MEWVYLIFIIWTDLHMLTRSRYVKNAKITKPCCEING